jgi:hypothetical protein
MSNKNGSMIKILTFELPIFIVLAAGLPLTQYASSGLYYYIQSLAATVFWGYLFRKSENSNSVFLLASTFLAAGFHKRLFLNYGFNALDKSLKALAFVLFLLSLWLLIADFPRLKDENKLRLGLAAISSAAILIWPPYFLCWLPVILPVFKLKFSFAVSKTGDKNGYFFIRESVWLFPSIVLLLRVLAGFFFGRKPFIYISPKYLRLEEFKQVLKFSVVLLPVLLLIILAWKKLLPLFEKEKHSNNFILLAGLHPLFVFSLTFFISYPATDSRDFYIAALLFGQICLFAFLGISGPKGVKDAWNLFASSITSKPLLLLAALVYMLKAWNYFFSY